MKYAIPLLLIGFLASSASAQMKSSLMPTDFAALAIDGSIVDTTALRGKLIVLNLWFVDCPNCVDEIKVLNGLVDEYRGNKDVVFIAPAASSRADLDRFLAKNPFKYRIIPNASRLILHKFGTPDKNGEIQVFFPQHYVLDREGKVVVRVQGANGIDAVRAELRRQLTLGPAKGLLR